VPRRALALLDDNGDLVFHHAYGEAVKAVIGLRLKPGQGIAGWVAQSGQSILVPDAHADPHFYGEVAPGFTTRDMVCVPLVVRDEIIGVIELLNKRQRAFAKDDVRLLESVATQAATAIENARLFEETRQRVAELEALQRTSLQITSSLDLPAVLDSIVESALALVGATDCHIYLYDEANETFTFGAALWEDGRREAAVKAPRSDGFTATVAREGCLLVINDVAHHPLYATPEAQKWNLQAIAGFPLKRAGRVLGVFNIAFLEPHTFAEEELRVLGLLADQAAVAIENARLYKETRQRAKELSILYDVATAATISVHLDDILNRTTDALMETLRPDSIAILLLEPEAEELVIRAWAGFPEGPTLMRRPVGVGIPGWVVQTGGAVLLADVRGDPRYHACDPDTRSELCVPLQMGERVIGALSLESHRLAAFDEDDLRLLSTLAGNLAAIIEDAWLFEEAQRHVAELEALQRTSLQLISSLDLSSVLDSVAESALTLVRATNCHIYLYDEASETFTFSAALWKDGRREAAVKVPRRDGFTATVAREGRLMVINDAAHHPLYATPEAQKWNLQVIAGFPLKRAGRVLGVFNIAFFEPHTFSEEELRVLGLLADQAAIAIENARLFGDVEQAKAEWEATFDAIGDGISIHDRDFCLVRVNRALTERLGIAPEALVGCTCYELFHHTTAPPDWCPHLKATKTGQPQVAEVEEPVLGGTFLVSAYPLFDEQGQVSGSVHVLKDITERKQLEAQLRQAQKMEAIGQLAAGICHDFNNLLTPMGGFADLLLWKAPEGSQQQKYLRQIKTAAERAADLTGQLLLFTRQARGERRSVQLNSVVEETRDLLERSIPKEITIELDLASGLWMVEADFSQISQVLMNLCLNACDAMPDGGTLTLETRNVTLDEEWARAMLEAQPGRYVRLSVSDTGSGMSPEVQARLFEPFFTTKEVGQGTGLGLSVIYGIVKGHDGFINVYSQEGRGSTFHVYLPTIELVVEEREIEEWDLATGTETILVVDDEEMVRALGQAVLELCGYTVLMAEDGLQALEVYRAHRGEIALVVLDVIMPKLGGQECLRRLREMDPQVKVLISTGYTAKGLAQELVAEGALGVVEKPFQIRDFAAAVRAALDKP